MTAPAISVSPDAPYEAVVRCLLKHRISGVPVVAAGGVLVGVVTDTDLAEHRSSMHADVTHLCEKRAADLMTADAVTAGLDEDLDVVARRMLACGVRRIPVVRASEVVGIVSLHDLLHAVDWAADSDPRHA
jgi:CBS domain-containing protein